MWKRFLFDHKSVKIILKELSTQVPAMPIINPEKRTLGPSFSLPILRLHDVENDRNSIFIIAPYKAFIRNRCIRFHDSIALKAALRRFVVRNHDPLSRLQRMPGCLYAAF